MRALAPLALLLVACGTPPSRAAGPPAASGSAVGFSRPPVVEGSRRACLEPPFTPGDAGTLADGTPVTAVGEGRGWVVTLDGEQEPDATEVHAAIDELREQPGLRFVSHGLYCGEHTRMCLRLAGNLCELRVEEAVATLRAGLAAVPSLAGRRFEVMIELAGALGPRCEEDDRACGPVPYEGGTYDPLGSRIGGAFPSHSRGACDYDGECVVMGCGNHCALWEFGGANEGATCEGYAFPQPVFCGCVEGECQWFRQR
ncbi:MAG: hypothetical protein KC619_13545 [Myxococcales bacterium]|nr:hypothetical protein [Myxococcales bacterium]